MTGVNQQRFFCCNSTVYHGRRSGAKDSAPLLVYVCMLGHNKETAAKRGRTLLAPSLPDFLHAAIRLGALLFLLPTFLFNILVRLRKDQQVSHPHPLEPPPRWAATQAATRWAIRPRSKLSTARALSRPSRILDLGPVATMATRTNWHAWGRSKSSRYEHPGQRQALSTYLVAVANHDPVYCSVISGL